MSAPEPDPPAPDLAPARPIVTIRTGAHLYGIATAASDLDATVVVLPAGRDILLQRVTDSHAAQDGAEDAQTHSLHRFLALLASGHPLAVEMLFAPDASLLGSPDPLWRDVQAVGPSLITRSTRIFARYCRRQADQYGLKGGRVAAARTVLEALRAAEDAHGAQARLADIEAELARLVSAHVALVDIDVQIGRTVRHLDLCGRRAPLTATIRAARVMAERLVSGYGARALQAEREDGADWKALSHAVRIGREAVELFNTGRLRFPLDSAARLLDIKLGRVPYSDIVEEIETLLDQVERSAAASRLPDAPDTGAAETLVLRAYASQVTGAVG